MSSRLYGRTCRPGFFRIGVVSTVVATLTFVQGSAAVASESSTVVTPKSQAQTLGIPGSDGITRWNFRLRLRDSRTEWRQGEPLKGGGCRFAGSAKGNPDSSGVLEEREVAFDPHRCKIEVEIGRPTAGDLTASEGDSEAKTAELSPKNRPKDVKGSSGALAAATFSTRAFAKTFYEDPPQIDVNSVRAEVNWSYDGYCVVGSSYHTARWGWYSPTGWVREATDWGTYNSCYSASTNVYAKYRNAPFCFPWTTYTEYDRTWIVGYYQGSWYAQWNSYKWGGCTNLLSHHAQYGYF